MEGGRSSHDLMIDAIILAGGKGTRLAEVLPSRQKVTADVAGRPFLHILLEWLTAYGIGRIVLAAGHRSEDVRAAIEGAQIADARIMVEPAPLGTGGATRFAISGTGSDPVLVMNGDSFAPVDIPALLEKHLESGASATIALVRVPKPGRYGLVESDETGAVRSFTEKPDATPDEGWINAGIYIFRRSVIEALEAGREVSLEREVFPSLIGKGLHSCRFETKFIDIGTPSSFAQAQSFFSEMRS